MTNQAFDITEELNCGSQIQHGPYNDRIYLMKATTAEEHDDLPARLIANAKKSGYAKIFAKVPAEKAGSFLEHKFIKEAVIPGFFNGDKTGLFLAYYLKKSRKVEDDLEAYEKNLQIALSKKHAPIRKLDEKFRIRSCNADDIGAMAEIYKTVFPSYPFPIHDPAYLHETMLSHVDYFCVETAGKLVALSSAEKDDEASNAEMTDFATLPEWLGNGFGVHLLQHMENTIKTEGIRTAYTIARAASPGMNITFAKLGYIYGGRLKNNTNISGQIESMNVWYKSLV